MPAALLGLPLRSFLLPKGIAAVSRGKNPPIVYPAGFLIAHPYLPTCRRAAIFGLCPFRESLRERDGFSTLPAGCSLGFCPSRVYPCIPWPGFCPASSHALSSHTRPRSSAIATEHSPRRLRVSISLHLAPPAPAAAPQETGKAALLGFPHRSVPEHSSRPPSGL
jgi:hypothetical protein